MQTALIAIGSSIAYAGDSLFTIAAAENAQGTLTISVVDDEDGVGGTATVGGTDDSATNAVYYRTLYASTWTLAGTRSGDGTVDVDAGVGEYFVKVTNTYDGDEREEITHGIFTRGDNAYRYIARQSGARNALQIAKQLGDIVTYYPNQDDSGLSLYAIIHQLSHTTRMRDGQTDIFELVVEIPRQTGFPPTGNFKLGAIVETGNSAYQVERHESVVGEFDTAPSFRLYCSRFGYQVEMGSFNG